MICGKYHYPSTTGAFGEPLFRSTLGEVYSGEKLQRQGLAVEPMSCRLTPLIQVSTYYYWNQEKRTPVF